MTGQILRMETFALEANVPGGPRAAARARRLVRDELGGRVPDELLPDVALLVTELVANSVRHGGAGAGTELHVRFECGPRVLLVEVRNPEVAAGAIGCRPPDLDGGGGLGLHIVEHLASRWGVREGARTVVWFELDCPPDGLL
jgi:anti-sigma regulatory factor (Ser/Thr protein kinase)